MLLNRVIIGVILCTPLHPYEITVVCFHYIIRCFVEILNKVLLNLNIRLTINMITSNHFITAVQIMMGLISPDLIIKC